MLHTFEAMSVKTAKKDGTKYLGKNGTQAWRVSIKIKDEWYSNMIWEEDMLPVKGREYNIELSEKDGFKNWAFKLLSKKEQILGQTKKPFFDDESIIEKHHPGELGKSFVPSVPSYMNKNNPLDVPGNEQRIYKDPVQERIIKGMCFNNACTLLKNSNEFDSSNAKAVLELSKALHKEMYDWLTT